MQAPRLASSAELNTHHLAKLIALVTMTIDHIGAYLYPDYLWLRAIGRCSAPIWFFLIGQALHYRVRRETVVWAAVFVAINPLLGESFFPWNVLVTIIFYQLALGYIERHAWIAKQSWALCVTCIVLVLATYPLIEYGTVGLLYALMGQAVRSKQMTWRTGKMIAVVAYVTFVGTQQLMFQFDPAQLMFVALGTGPVTLGLSRFVHRRVQVMPMLQEPSRWVVGWSRVSLQYYVVHRVVLQAVGVLLGALNPTLRLFPG